jgi:hypothetical protein
VKVVVSTLIIQHYQTFIFGILKHNLYTKKSSFSLFYIHLKKEKDPVSETLWERRKMSKVIQVN